MDIFILPIIFSIRAAITILQLLPVCSICTFKSATRFTIDFIQDLYQWIKFLLRIAICSYTGRFWWFMLQIIFIIPITFYTFFHGVYSFGPKHRKRSFFDILKNPVPGIEYEGRIGESDDFDSIRRRRFNHNIVARRIARSKALSQRRITRSNVAIIHDCPRSHIDSNAPRLYGYETYFTLHNGSMSKRATEGEHSMPMTIYFAICQFSCPDIVFLKLPRKPPNGLITSTLVNVIIASIFGVITFQTCIRITKRSFVSKIKATIRRCIYKSIWAEPEKLSGSLFWDLMIDTKTTISNARRSCIPLCQESLTALFKILREICKGIPSVQIRILREIRKLPHLFSLEQTLPSIQVFTVFAHSTLTDLKDLDPLSSFDADSSFWVCDNSATGHICNNTTLFTDDLVPSIFEIGSATGILIPTLMGTVILRITDDKGEKHSFTLKNVNYLPDSPVNIFSIRRLAELYSDDSGHPDGNGTGGKFRKTF